MEEVFLSKTSFILDVCIEVRWTEKQPWKMVQREKKHRGRTAAPTTVPGPNLLSCRETPGSTNSMRKWKKKKNQDVHQKISGHLFYSFLHKFILMLIITLAWLLLQMCRKCFTNINSPSISFPVLRELSVSDDGVLWIYKSSSYFLEHLICFWGFCDLRFNQDV